LHRSIVADVGITTPKQMSKTLIKYSSRHPEVELSRYVIPQVPGLEARSAPVHGVVESFLKSKKYIVPSAVVSPIFAGCVVAVYVGTGGGRIDPSRDALVYNSDRDLEKPLGAEDRRSYQLELNHLLGTTETREWSLLHSDHLHRLLRTAIPDLDADGRPVLRIRKGPDLVNVGLAENNLFSDPAAASFTQQLIEARLRAELKRGVPKASESDISHDWDLLQELLNNSTRQVVAQTHHPVPPAPTRLESSATGTRP
jgi:hypothetical protein